MTKDSARVTADALNALGRTEEANALRERTGTTVASVINDAGQIVGSYQIVGDYQDNTQHGFL